MLNQLILKFIFSEFNSGEYPQLVIKKKNNIIKFINFSHFN